MSLTVINNGTFDNDPSSDKIRINFDDAKANFLEIYTTIPDIDPANLVGNAGKILVVDATGNFFELVALAGGGDMLASNNLADVDNAATSRTNLGLGTAATQATSAFATSAQGTLADAAVRSVVAGTGISVNVADPLNPIVTNTETNDYVVTAALAPATGILTLTLFGAGTVTVDLSAYLRLQISGFDVVKDVGNSNYTTIEVNDLVTGWLTATRYIVGKVNALPYVTEGNITFVLDNSL